MSRTRSVPAYARAGNPLSGIPWNFLSNVHDVSNYLGYSNDFARWEGPAGTNLATTTEGGWTATIIALGAGNAGAIQVLDSLEGGYLELLTDNASGDNINLVMDGSHFRYELGKELWFATKFRIDDVDAAAVAMGLVIENLTDFVGTFPTDAIFFEKAAAGTVLNAHVRKNGTSTEDTTASATLTDATDHIAGFHVNKAGSIEFFDGTSLNALTVNASVASSDANIPDDEDLSPFLGVETGAAAGHSLRVDWVVAVSEV